MQINEHYKTFYMVSLQLAIYRYESYISWLKNGETPKNLVFDLV